MSNRKSLVMRGVAECVTEDELDNLLEDKKTPKAYVGFEPSGLLHAGSLIPMLKCRELIDAGFEVTILLADWHGYINDKLGGNWENLNAGVEYQRQMFSIFCPGVRFKTASEIVSEEGYWEMVLRVSKVSSLKRMRRALSIMGRDETDGDKDMSKFFYPAMQATDIYALDVDLALGGMDQRHAHMLARDAADKMKLRKPIALHTPLVGSLSGPGRMDTDAKMSKSNPSGTLLIHDSKKKLTKKLSKAYCPQERKGNPVLDLWQYLLEPALGNIVIERPEKFGGDLSFESFSKLEENYTSGSLHPLDLKNGTAAALFQVIKPMQDACATEPENYVKLLSATQ
ncbi:MAG: tyrosine--tRNA ligase [Candidatus Thermoplasmatota archaeon]|nr:tyrosine--tRNA ligase [Candidatus Thermoplasmatota archaeon]